MTTHSPKPETSTNPNYTAGERLLAEWEKREGEMNVGAAIAAAFDLLIAGDGVKPKPLHPNGKPVLDPAKPQSPEGSR